VIACVARQGNLHLRHNVTVSTSTTKSSLLLLLLVRCNYQSSSGRNALFWNRLREEVQIAHLPQRDDFSELK
jgi:hypothetical protein